MKRLFLIFIFGLFSPLLFAQDTLHLVPIDFDLPPRNYEHGSQQAKNDIFRGILIKRLKFKPWCKNKWKAEFERTMLKEYGITVEWNRMSTLPKPMNCLPPGGSGRSMRDRAYYNGYYSTMDSVVHEKISHQKLDSLLLSYKAKYGVNEENCPSEMYSFGYMSIPKPLNGKAELENMVNKKVKEINSKFYGTIGLQLAVTSTGKVIHVEVIRGIGPEVNDLTKKLLLETEFTPCIKKGKPINCTFSYVLKIQNPKK